MKYYYLGYDSILGDTVGQLDLNSTVVRIGRNGCNAVPPKFCLTVPTYLPRPQQVVRLEDCDG